MDPGDAKEKLIADVENYDNGDSSPGTKQVHEEVVQRRSQSSKIKLHKSEDDNSKSLSQGKIQHDQSAGSPDDNLATNMNVNSSLKPDSRVGSNGQMDGHGEMSLGSGVHYQSPGLITKTSGLTSPNEITEETME